MPGQFHKADQVAATLTAVTVEQIFSGIDIEGRPGIGVQRTQPHELLAATDAATGPGAPLQVLQQRNPLFDLFHVLVHRCFFPFWSEPMRKPAAFPGEDGGSMMPVVSKSA